MSVEARKCDRCGSKDIYPSSHSECFSLVFAAGGSNVYSKDWADLCKDCQEEIRQGFRDIIEYRSRKP